MQVLSAYSVSKILSLKFPLGLETNHESFNSIYPPKAWLFQQVMSGFLSAHAGSDLAFYGWHALFLF